jgi:hypothetical protein
LNTKIIDTGYGCFPTGFSELLLESFNPRHIDALATKDLTDKFIPYFESVQDFYLVKAKNKKEKHVTYYEIGEFYVLDVIYSKGDYIHSLMTVRRELENENGSSSEVIGLVYDEKGKLYAWYPTFEELFLTLILDDLENQTAQHLKSIHEIQKHLHDDIDVHSVAVKNAVDYDIVRQCFHSDIPIPVVAYYSLIKHIMNVEDQKYPKIPGSVRTLNAYGDLFKLNIKDKNEVIKWRQKYLLPDPWA